MHDRPGRPRSVGYGLAAALGAWLVVLADPALAAERASVRGAPEPPEGKTAETVAPAGESSEGATDEPAAEPTAVAPATEDAEGTTTEESDADETTIEPATTEPPVEPAASPRPPRIDGTYVGGTLVAGVGLVRVNDFDTGGAFASFGGTFTVGQMVFPWLGLGLHGGGGGAVRSQDGVRQRLGQGHLGVQFKLVPLPKRHVPLSLLASFGFGGGAVRQAGIDKRSGFGGAQFGAAVRYELFPWAAKRRPYRGGGFGLGPELGWVGFTPAAPGRPMFNLFYLALSATFYFGS